MLVELPHALNEYVEDIELDVLADVGKIFLAKHSDPKLSVLMYVYSNNKIVLRYLDCNHEYAMSKFAIKKATDLDRKSTPWDSTHLYVSMISGTYITNPIEGLKLRVLNLGLDIEDYEYYICNWTTRKLTTHKTNSVLYPVVLSTYGYFSPLKDYSVFTDNWRDFTYDDYRRHYGDLQLYNKVLKTYTNDREITTKDPRSNFYDDMISVKPPIKAIYQSRSYFSDPPEQEQRPNVKKNCKRKELVLLHLIFQKLRKMNIEMLVLLQMLPTPKYTIGSFVDSFCNLFKHYIIRDIYMYLDLNYSWNIKYLCADFDQVNSLDNSNIDAVYVRQRQLSKSSFASKISHLEEKVGDRESYFKQLQFVDRSYTIKNTLFEYDHSVYKHNKQAEKCQNTHFKFRWRCPEYNCRQRVNFKGIKCKYHSGDKNWRIKCHHKWCPGPKKIDESTLGDIFPVIKIVKMGNHSIQYYEKCSHENQIKRNFDGTCSNNNVASHLIKHETDLVHFSWKYTKDYVS